MACEPLAIHGHLSLSITRPDGTVLAGACGRNTVVDGGRQLVAQLLAGTATEPQFAITAGIADNETLPDLTKLFDPDELLPVPVTEVKTKDGLVTLRASFPAAEKDRLIKEAGLMLTCTVDGAKITTLYNRALVKPHQQVRNKEVLTLTWQLSFAPQGA